MFHKNQYIVGFVRAHARHSLKAQRAAMTNAGVEKVYEEDIELLIRQRRDGHGDVVAITDAHLLADPKAKRKKGGLRAEFYRVLDALHLKGVTVWELSTNYRSSDTRERELMNRKAVETMARTRIYDKIGRPPKVWSVEQRAIIKKHWFSTAHMTNAAAISAIRKAGVQCSASQAAKLFGKSNRMPGNPKLRKWQEERKRRVRDAVVYFVQRGHGPIKIGMAIDVRNRLLTLQNGTPEPLRLLGTVPGGQKMELEMHRRFAAYRIGGEWFRCKGELAEFVKTLKKT